jgi:predicted dehydrogenase
MPICPTSGVDQPANNRSTPPQGPAKTNQTNQTNQSNQIDRRSMLLGSAAWFSLAQAGFWTSTAAATSRLANEKIRLGFVGTANQARFSIDSLRGQDFVAFCDVDQGSLGKAREEFPQATFFSDYRKMLELPGLDAVVVCTPDHLHAPASMRAIREGKHVYCEKPLTHTVAEARALTLAAREAGVATQMGIQIHSGDNYRRVVELIRSGVIGKVREVHTWAGRSWTASGLPQETVPVPETLDWDLYLGPAQPRPYSRAYHPANWRSYWVFGGGNLADMACHHLDLPVWALNLKHPSRIEAEGPPVDPEGCPAGLKVTYDFAAEGDQPECRLTWYDGTMIPESIYGIPTQGGNLFVGEEGYLLADYGRWKLFPEEKFSDYQPPAPSINSSPGHHAEWLAACRGETTATCNFDYSGPLTEIVLLGNVAYRSGLAIEWDSAEMKIINHPAAEQWLSKEYRPGFEL